MKINKTIELNKNQVEGLKKALGFQLWAIGADFNNIDYSKGQGVGNGNDRCLWFKDGKRLDVSISSDGGIIASIRKENEQTV